MNQQYKQFGFNPDSAKQADSSLRIEEAGKYVGVIKHMEFITAKSGTTGFEIEFEDEDDDLDEEDALLLDDEKTPIVQ